MDTRTAQGRSRSRFALSDVRRAPVAARAWSPKGFALRGGRMPRKDTIRMGAVRRVVVVAMAFAALDAAAVIADRRAALLVGDSTLLHIAGFPARLPDAADMTVWCCSTPAARWGTRRSVGADARWMQRERILMVRTVAEQQLEMAAIGDSLTTGFFLSSLIGTMGRVLCPPSRSWFSDRSGAIRSLSARLDETGLDVTVSNYATRIS